MKVNFQLLHDSDDFDAIIFDALKSALESLYIEKSDDEIKLLYENKYNLSLLNSKWIAGFEVEANDISLDDHEAFLENYVNKMKEDGHVFALIKFHDEIRFKTYLNYYREIAKVEMHLREILSCIFYYEYSDDFYSLLEEYEINFPKDTPPQEGLQERLENQFFYLTFSNYFTLDRPKEIRHVKDMNAILESSDSYEGFRDRICNRGIKNEKHRDFLAAIKQDLQTIESVRNAVAHNRTISPKNLGHYETARDHLIERFKVFWDDTSVEK